MSIEERRLSKLETNQVETNVLLKTLIEKVDSRIEATDDWREQVNRTLFGYNGTTPSLLVKLDRLEQSQARQTWWVRAVSTIVVALAVSNLWSSLGG